MPVPETTSEPRPAPLPADRRAAVAQQLGRQQRTLHAIRAVLTRDVSDTERAHVHLLVVLGDQGPMRAAALAEAVHADPSTVSRQTAQLVARGLVERRPDPTDGRASRLAVTAAGEELLAAVNARRCALYGEVLRDWEPAEADRFVADLQRFTTCLERVRAELTDGTSPLLDLPHPTSPAEAAP